MLTCCLAQILSLCAHREAGSAVCPKPSGAVTFSLSHSLDLHPPHILALAPSPPSAPLGQIHTIHSSLPAIPVSRPQSTRRYPVVHGASAINLRFTSHIYGEPYAPVIDELRTTSDLFTAHAIDIFLVTIIAYYLSPAFAFSPALSHPETSGCPSDRAQ
ncbi:hypothetical protein C8R48DRAFT_781486 [Suillus tomentosus]|nr:hypothetical protein C8R48DRAFT_781486 [Suillus tomentosus]